DRIAFTFVSDEFNGQTADNTGNVRPRVMRSFRRLSEAEDENGSSRIYLGIHWAFDKSEGVEQGRRVRHSGMTRPLLPAGRLAALAPYKARRRVISERRAMGETGGTGTMSIKSDKWIRRMAAQGMIEPFEPGQVRERAGQRIVSYGTSS